MSWPRRAAAPQSSDSHHPPGQPEFKSLLGVHSFLLTSILRGSVAFHSQPCLEFDWPLLPWRSWAHRHTDRHPPAPNPGTCLVRFFSNLLTIRVLKTQIPVPQEELAEKDFLEAVASLILVYFSSKLTLTSVPGIRRIYLLYIEFTAPFHASKCSVWFLIQVQGGVEEESQLWLVLGDQQSLACLPPKSQLFISTLRRKAIEST